MEEVELRWERQPRVLPATHRDVGRWSNAGAIAGSKDRE
jgi:hypothetical protein